MNNPVRSRYDLWKLRELLSSHPGLRIAPSANSNLLLEGLISLNATGPDGQHIVDEYGIAVTVPEDFPRSLPLVRETTGRIPRGYHKLSGNNLCLGTPTEQRLQLAESPTLPAFITRLVVPYLYGYSYFELHERMPFGELTHGDQGIRDHLGELYRAPPIEGVEEFLSLTALKKRVANKRPCPCLSGLRLGRCHNRVVNSLRSRLGRTWFRDEYDNVSHLLREPQRTDVVRKEPSLRELLAIQHDGRRGAIELSRTLQESASRNRSRRSMQNLPVVPA